MATRLLSYGFFASVAALGLGCAQGSSGALGQTQSSAACPPSDLVCAVAGIDAPLAKGAALAMDVTVTSEGTTTPPLTLRSANPRVFTVDEGRLFGVAPGLGSLLVMTDGNLVLDFLHIWVAEVDHVRLHRKTAQGTETSPMPASMQVLVGDELTIVAAPHSSGGQRLLGDIEATFAADPLVLTVLDEGIPGSRRIVAKAPGTATIAVSALGSEASTTVEVLP